MTIPDLYALLERLAANADEQKRYRDAAELRDGMKALRPAAEACFVMGTLDDYLRAPTQR